MSGITKSQQNNITSPSGNSLALFVDSISNEMKVKDVMGNIQPVTDFIPIAYVNLLPIPSELVITGTGAGVLTKIDFAFFKNQVNPYYFYQYPYLGLSYPDPNKGLNAFSNGKNNADINFTSMGDMGDFTVSNFEAFVQDASSEDNTPVIGLPTCTSASFPDLIYMYGGSQSSINFAFSNIATVQNLYLPKLEFVSKRLTLPISAIVTMDFPSLKVVGEFIANLSTVLQNLNVPEALQIGFSDATNSAIKSVNFPKAKIVTLLSIGGTKSGLTSILMPSVEYCTAITFPTISASLVDFTFGSSLKFYGTSTTAGNFVTTSNSLNQASVDNILVSLANLDGTNGTTAFSTRTVTITGGASTPSATGLTAKAVLVARGCTVTTN